MRRGRGCDFSRLADVSRSCCLALERSISKNPTPDPFVFCLLLLFRIRLDRRTRRFLRVAATRCIQIPLAAIGVVLIERKRIVIAQEMPQVGHRDGKPEPLAQDQLHVGHAHHFTLQIEQRATTVTWVDVSRRLNVRQTFEVAIPSTDNPL